MYVTKYDYERMTVKMNIGFIAHSSKKTLIALSISASENENAQKALDALEELKGCQLHCSSRLSKVDLSTLRKLGLQVTMEPVREHVKVDE